jgi:hypothetical protein
MRVQGHEKPSLLSEGSKGERSLRERREKLYVGCEIALLLGGCVAVGGEERDLRYGDLSSRCDCDLSGLSIDTCAQRSSFRSVSVGDVKMDDCDSRWRLCCRVTDDDDGGSLKNWIPSAFSSFSAVRESDLGVEALERIRMAIARMKS